MFALAGKTAGGGGFNHLPGPAPDRLSGTLASIPVFAKLCPLTSANAHSFKAGGEKLLVGRVCAGCLPGCPRARGVHAVCPSWLTAAVYPGGGDRS